jgi:hypothetical protein
MWVLNLNATGAMLDRRLVGHCKIRAGNRPSSTSLLLVWRAALGIQRFYSRFGPDALSREAVKGNPTTTAIPGVDESEPSHSKT